MSHEITIREDGFVEAAFSLQPAWHGLGTVFDEVMTSRQAIEGAGLDWTVQQEPVFRSKSSLGNPPVYEEVPGLFFNVRSDNGKILGTVTNHYKVIQNVEAFEFLDALVENHEMRYESAFSLYGGRWVVLLARMPGVDKIIENDPVLRYIMMSIFHDGTGAIKFGPTAVRVVCANTYALALSAGPIRELSIRHKGDIKAKLSQARNILGIASREFEQYAEHSQVLAERRLAATEWREYLDIICPLLDPRDPDYTERRAANLSETRRLITRAYTNERQATAPNTAWAAYNAVAEHIDHLPRRGASSRKKAEARFNVCLYGTGMNMKERAFRTACRFAGIDLSA